MSLILEAGTDCKVSECAANASVKAIPSNAGFLNIGWLPRWLSDKFYNISLSCIVIMHLAISSGNTANNSCEIHEH